MPIDTRGVHQEHVGKRLRVEFAGGEVDEIELLELTICDPPEPCCGITYTLLSTNRSDERHKIANITHLLLRRFSRVVSLNRGATIQRNVPWCV